MTISPTPSSAWIRTRWPRCPPASASSPKPCLPPCAGPPPGTCAGTPSWPPATTCGWCWRGSPRSPTCPWSRHCCASSMPRCTPSPIPRGGGPGGPRAPPRRAAARGGGGPGSDTALASVRASAGTPGPPADLALLAGLLDGTTAIDGLVVDTELRWRLLHRLVSRGAAGYPEIAAELDRDPTDAGARHAATRRAPLHHPAAKAGAPGGLGSGAR